MAHHPWRGVYYRLDKKMKKLAIALIAVLTLSSSAVAGLHGGVGFRFGGGHYRHWQGGGRFWAPFGLGLGLGALLSWPLYYGPDYYCAPGYDFWYASPYPAYSYVPAPPASLYRPPAVHYSATVPIPDPPKPAPQASATTAWVPADRGAGKWVPDPAPYSYTPGAAKPSAQAPFSETPCVVTITHSAGGVPIYIVGR